MGLNVLEKFVAPKVPTQGELLAPVTQTIEAEVTFLTSFVLVVPFVCMALVCAYLLIRVIGQGRRKKAMSDVHRRHGH